MTKMLWTAAAGVVAAAMTVVGGCRSGSPDAGGSASPAATPKAGVSIAMLDGDQLIGPFVHANLSVYLVANPKVADGREFITLDEGLHSGLVTINESGGSSGEDNSRVAELEVTNKSGKWLYIEAGEIVRGGKQDRTMARDLVVKPGAKNEPLASFCVEQGRWTKNSAVQLGQFTTDTLTKERLETLKTTNGSDWVGPSATEVTAVKAVENLDKQAADKGLAFTGAVANLPATAKIAVLKNKNQGQVWQAVEADRNSNGAVQSLSGTFMDVVNDKQVRARAKPYVTELLEAVKTRTDLIGAIFAVDGRVVAADIYAAPGLFKRLYPKLLEAHARDAALTADPKQPTPAPPSMDAVQAFVKLAQTGQVTTETVTGAQTMDMCENDETISFASKDGEKRMHYSAVRKK